MNKPKLIEKNIPSSSLSLQPVKEIFGVPVYADNPFLEAFGIVVKKKSSIVASGLQITDQEGEEINCGIVGRITEVDSETFIKMYTSNLSNFFDLSSSAIKVLVILLKEIQEYSKDRAEVYISYDQVKIYCQNENKKLSQPTFSRGIKELINNKFIAKSIKGSGWYWINPSIIFNGDRVRFVNEYRIKRKEEKLKLRY